MRRERTQKDEAGCGKEAAPKPVPPKSIYEPLHGDHLIFCIDCGTTLLIKPQPDIASRRGHSIEQRQRVLLLSV